MHHHTRVVDLHRLICGIFAACAIFFAASTGAQEWPAPPPVNGTFDAGHMAKAKSLETALSCHRDNIYCSDALVQDFKQRLLESAAAALNRMPDVEGRRDIAPSSLNLFHQNLLACNREAVVECSSRADKVQDKYDVLTTFPAGSVQGDSCQPAVEKACTISLLTERIEAWNKRNTEEDSNPVLASNDPGFDCKRRLSAAMQTVCRDAELSALHREMLERLNSLPKKFDRNKLSRERAEVLTDHYWHTASYRCQDDKTCIRAKIEERIQDIANIASEMGVITEKIVAHEGELETERRLEALASHRAQLSEFMGGIVADATMPSGSSLRTHENVREFERAIRIADIEQGLSELASREGRVYRGLWFWSQFRNPSAMRSVFRGNRSVPFTAEEGAIYFHNSYALERGNVDQMGMLTAWVRVYASMCSHLLPTPPDELRIQTFTTSGPLINRTTNLTSTDVLKFQAGLMRPYSESRKALEAKQLAAAQNNLWGRAFEIMSGGLGAVSAEARSQLGPYIYAQDDFIRFLDAVGCDSPTARQMSQGISMLARGGSLPSETTEAAIAGAEWVSDVPQAAGEFRHHSEICWDYEIGGHNACGCLVDVAGERLGEKDGLSASVAYPDVHKAFMTAPEASQKICRDPIGAISGGLLSTHR
ncbi:hypothetical protein [Allohahella marinimesophila]|uniref:Secreted protein n=1 Tax=Allohahella marinimesophila TaxID=1054972 RepID=A0ABP7NYN2_9GAMM